MLYERLRVDMRGMNTEPTFKSRVQETRTLFKEGSNTLLSNTLIHVPENLMLKVIFSTNFVHQHTCNFLQNYQIIPMFSSILFQEYFIFLFQSFQDNTIF